MALERFLGWFLPRNQRQQQRRKPARPRLMLEVLEDRLMPAVLHVGSSSGEYADIQSAINAAKNGDVVLVGPGVYQQQLTISKSITIEADLGCDQRCQGNSAVILAPTNMSGPTVADPGALVHVTGSGVCADISGLVIEGAPATSTTGAGDANLLYGVRVDGGASADVNFNTIANIVDTSNPSLGVGVSVGNAADSDDGLGAQVGTAIISLNNIVNYQRGGVVVSNTGSSAVIALNNIAGTSISPADSITGVEISEGAVGLVSLNAISNNANQSNGCGVLLYDSGQGTTIAANVIFGNDYGIFGANVVASTANSCDQGIAFSCDAGFSSGGFGQVCVGGFNGCNDVYQPGQGYYAPDNAVFGNNYGFFGSCFGISAGYGQTTSVAGNFITGNTFVGIEFDYSSGVTISGNTTNNNGGTTYYAEDGGIFLYESTGITVANNASHNNFGSGIIIDSTCSGNIIQNNVMSGNYYYYSAAALADESVSADAVDLSSGNGTAGTADTWTDNTAQTSITISGQSLIKTTKPHHFGITQYGF